MKTLAKIVGSIVVFLVLVLVVLRITGLNPIGDTPGPGNYPGLWLSGAVVTTPITNWSFVSKYKTDKVQTRTWYMIPHSVTTGFIVHDGVVELRRPHGSQFGKHEQKRVLRLMRGRLSKNSSDASLPPSRGQTELSRRCFT